MDTNQENAPSNGANRGAPAAVSHARLVPFRRMRSMEAQLAKTKLESEGIPCFVADELIAITNPFVFSEVELQVPEDQVELAGSILDAPPTDAKAEDYVDETWRCPVCHRRKVELLPLSTGWQIAKLTFILMVAAPFLLRLAHFAVPDQRFIDATRRFEGEWVGVWMLMAAALGASILLTKRRKHCEDCGHVWTDKKPATVQSRDDDDEAEEEDDTQEAPPDRQPRRDDEP